MPDRRIATVLMVDVVGSTHVAAELGDVRYRELSRRFDRLVRDGLKRYGGREEDHAGDGFFTTFPQPDRAIRCAAALAEAVRALGIEIRAGIHTGQTESQGGKTQGIAVVIGARVMSLADAGELLVTSTTKELVAGSGFGFEDLSAHELKGVPGTWQVFAVTSVDGEERARPLPAAEAAERRAAITPRPERERPRSRMLIAAAVGLVVAISAVAFAATRGDGNSPSTPSPQASLSGSVVRIDLETGERTRIFVASSRLIGMGLGHFADHGLVVGQGGTWVLRGWVLHHVDPFRDEVRSRVSFPASLETNVAEGLDAVWVVGDTGLYRVNPATDESVLVVRPPEQHLFSPDVVVGAGHVWVNDGSRLLKLDPGRATGRWRSLPTRVDSLALGHGSVWTMDAVASTVTRLDPGSMRPVSVIPIPGGADAFASGDQNLWALSRGVGSLTLIDVHTNTAAQTLRVGDAPTAMAAGLGAVWVGDEDGIIRRVDESTLKVSEILVGAVVNGLAIDEETETLWVDVA